MKVCLLPSARAALFGDRGFTASASSDGHGVTRRNLVLIFCDSE